MHRKQPYFSEEPDDQMGPECPINATHKVLVEVEEVVVVLQWLQLQQHLLVQLHLSLIW